MLSNIILTSIYVLALQDNKFFISKLSKDKGDMIDSFISHTNTTNLHSIFGNGAYWLELYPIVKIDKVIEEEIENYDYIVKDYMATYGAHNVRGGSFNDVVFQQDNFFELVKELNKNYARENLEGFDYQDQQITEGQEYNQKQEEYAERNHNEEYHKEISNGHVKYTEDDDDGYRVTRDNYDEDL